MNKSELITAVAERAAIKRSEAADALKAFEIVLKEVLSAGGKVTLPGFGTFKVRETAARTGRNPKTGEPVEIPARRKVKFMPSQHLKELVDH